MGVCELLGSDAYARVGEVLSGLGGSWRCWIVLWLILLIECKGGVEKRVEDSEVMWGVRGIPACVGEEGGGNPLKGVEVVVVE